MISLINLNKSIQQSFFDGLLKWGKSNNKQKSKTWEQTTICMAQNIKTTNSATVIAMKMKVETIH